MRRVGRGEGIVRAREGEGGRSVVFPIRCAGARFKDRRNISIGCKGREEEEEGGGRGGGRGRSLAKIFCGAAAGKRMH